MVATGVTDSIVSGLFAVIGQQHPYLILLVLIAFAIAITTRGKQHGNGGTACADRYEYSPGRWSESATVGYWSDLGSLDRLYLSGGYSAINLDPRDWLGACP